MQGKESQARDNDHLLRAEKGITGYLDSLEREGRLTGDYLAGARKNVFTYLKDWMTNPDIARLSPNVRRGLEAAIDGEKWYELVNAFARKVSFGTGGIRALMAFDRESIERFKKEGIDAPVLKGENTLNNVVLMRCAYGIARWFAEKGGRSRGAASKAVVGFDSRIQGRAFAEAISEVFLAEGMEVFLFDEPVPYPEVTFAVPTLGADVGLFISASHNDYRYNGFKLSGPNGAQIKLEQRNEIVDRINRTSFSDIRPVGLENLRERNDEALRRLHFLGGRDKSEAPEADYFGRDLIPMHDKYISQMKTFFMQEDLMVEGGPGEEMSIVFAAFNGAGRTTVPGLLEELGFKKIYPIQKLFNIDGLFPAFKWEPGEEQQPDPGDPRSAVIALDELAKEVKTHRKGAPGPAPIAWKDADLLIGTDPDADRCGVIVHPPKALAELIGEDRGPRYGADHMLVPADDLWTLVMWYRLNLMKDRVDLGDAFIALSHTTSDSLTDLARSHGLGVLKTWVGFAWLSTGVRQAWKGEVPLGISEGRLDESREKCDLVYCDTTMMRESHRLNLATMEQSNGFSILGSPPPGERDMGVGGHVLDKDGTLAAVLVAEIACHAKGQGTDLLSLLARHIYCDESVGVYVNYYEPDPLDGEYPGLEGDTKKKSILNKAEILYERANRGEAMLGLRKVTSARKYWTGKYDAINGIGFPDEGLRFYLEDSNTHREDKRNHVTIRPSGTTNSLRFHVQLHAGTAQSEEDGWERRMSHEAEAKAIIDDVRAIIGAPRAEGVRY